MRIVIKHRRKFHFQIVHFAEGLLVKITAGTSCVLPSTVQKMTVFCTVGIGVGLLNSMPYYNAQL